MLELGSIVYLKDGVEKVMILSRGPIVEEDGERLIFDYSGCIYPVGLDMERILHFNEENIDKVVFNGYHDGAEDRFQELYNEWMEENKDEYKKGVVPTEPEK